MLKYILIALTFVSCNNINKNASSNSSTEVVDTIKTRPARWDAKPMIFEAAFIKGTTHKVKNATIYSYGIDIGKIKITSGYLIACDPGHIDEYGIPFTQVFPNGEFPVQLSIAKVEYEETIAFARIKFSDEPVARWEFALQEGQKQIPLGEDDIIGYSTDLSAGIFIDRDASKVLDKSNLTDDDAELYKEMDKHYHYNWKYAIYNFGQHNLAAFTSGMGDGYYATYIGFDANGKPCRLLTDFDFISWRKK